MHLDLAFTTPPQTLSWKHLGTQKNKVNTQKNPKTHMGVMMWGDTCIGASVAGLLLVVGGVPRGRPRAGAVARSP